MLAGRKGPSLFLLARCWITPFNQPLFLWKLSPATSSIWIFLAISRSPFISTRNPKTSATISRIKAENMTQPLMEESAPSVTP